MDSATIALIAAVGIAATDTDQRISDYLSENNPVFGDIENAKNWSDWGKWSTNMAYLVTGAMTDSPVETTVLQTMSVRANSEITSRVKHTALRMRPDGEDRLSFYSGHAARTSLQAHHAMHNLKRIGYGEYAWIPHGVSIMTAYARVEGKKHYPTDVLVGYAAGKYLSKLTNLAFTIEPEHVDISYVVNF